MRDANDGMNGENFDDYNIPVIEAQSCGGRGRGGSGYRSDDGFNRDNCGYGGDGSCEGGYNRNGGGWRVALILAWAEGGGGGLGDVYGASVLCGVCILHLNITLPNR